jgi:hypothetical protein
MEQIGWSLVDSTGTEIQHWGDTPGVCVGVPDMIRLPSGDDVHCPSIGAVQEWALVPRHYDYADQSSGPRYADDKIVVTGSLADLKAQMKSRLASDAEVCRQQFITSGSGKAMSYLEKHNQAQAVIDLGEEAANALSEAERRATFPTLAASVELEAETLWDCAELIVTRYEAWATLSYTIERTEIAGKKSISDASDAASVRAAYEGITWPTP